MDLWILRHAKSSWKTPGLADLLRPLNHRGRDAACRVGRFLKNHAQAPAYIISSHACRALQTAERINDELHLPMDHHAVHAALYQCTPSTWFQHLAQLPEHIGSVLAIGHNPELEALVRTLSDRDLTTPDDGKLLPTATLAHFQVPAPWSAIGPHGGRLTSLIRPKHLDKPHKALVPKEKERD